jgi:hypothetical protein
MSFVINPFVFGDQDALAYIAAVEAADGQALESGVKAAINDFVVGCKSDGIWSAIKASCILAGARTLSGALVPLVGSAPTNNNFVSGDYDRETGLKGNGSTKYLDSNRADDDDPQNSKHISVHVGATDGGDQSYMGALSGSPLVGSQITPSASSSGFFRNNSSGSVSLTQYITQLGFIGTTRSSSSQISYRLGGSTSTVSSTSTATSANSIHVFGRNYSPSFFRASARLSFYSIGESINLADLDTRVSTLMTDIAAAIP